MANPKVRPHLSFYPEEKKKNVTDARQMHRWLHEAPDDQLTPMARLGRSDGSQDYYIHEPAMLRNGTCCIPVRWFKIGTSLYAKCWRMEAIATDVGQGWRVVKCEDFVVPATDFLKTFPELGEDAVTYGLPHPSTIFGQSSIRILNL